MNEPTAMSNAIYQAAKSCLDVHVTMNESVDPNLGCAEACSFVLNKAGIKMPAEGIAGTGELYSWLQSSGLFEQVTVPLPGDVIISPTGMSTKGSSHGHVGIIAMYGILSNSSSTGLFMEHYNLQTWNYYYNQLLGFPVYYFRAK